MTKLTPKKVATFLGVLAEGGTVKEGALAIGVSRQCLYQSRDTDTALRSAWDSALEEGTEVLEAEARRRAVEGTEKPVYQGGHNVGTVREYSDTLLIFLLKSRDHEKYRDNVKVTLVTPDEIKRVAEEHGVEATEVAELAEMIANGKA